MQRFIDLIPRELMNVSGAVFNSGKDAFRNPGAGLYLLGLNPGGGPEKHAERTVDYNLRKVQSRPDNWCEHRDESWDGRPPGSRKMQPRVLHVLKKLGLDPGTVPSSNVIFERTDDQEDLGSRWRALAQKCWPMHEAVIKDLKIRTIVCFGRVAGKFVREQLAAHRRLGAFVEKNNRRLATEAFENADGIAVIVATHPSRIAWNSPDSDPSEFIRSVMERKPGEQLDLHALNSISNEGSRTVPLAPATQSPIALTHSATAPSQGDVASNSERDARLAKIFDASGLGAVLERKPGVGKDPTFSKLFVRPNEFRILSVELYTNGAGKFRVHYAADAPYWLKEALRGLPGAKNSSSSGTDFVGDELAAGKALAGILAARRGPI